MPARRPWTCSVAKGVATPLVKAQDPAKPSTSDPRSHFDLPHLSSHLWCGPLHVPLGGPLRISTFYFRRKSCPSPSAPDARTSTLDFALPKLDGIRLPSLPRATPRSPPLWCGPLPPCVQCFPDILCRVILTLPCGSLPTKPRDPCISRHLCLSAYMFWLQCMFAMPDCVCCLLCMPAYPCIVF